MKNVSAWFIRATWAAVLGAAAGCSSESGSSGEAGSGGSPTTTSEGATGGSTTTTTTGPLTCASPVSDPPLTGDCDLLQQDCPIGETCVAALAGTWCKSGGGLKGPGKTCNVANGNNECQAGLVCIGTSMIGLCTRPCCPDTDEPCGGGECILSANYNGVLVRMCYYSQTCTLFEPGTCPAGLQCQIVQKDSHPLPICTYPSDDSVSEGEACTHVNQCGEAQVCFNGKCRYSCKIDGSGEPGTGGCLAGQTCLGTYPDLPDLGVCQ